MSNIIERARMLRAVIEQTVETLTDTDALNTPELFPAWSGDGVSYTTGQRLYRNGELVKVLQDHTSQNDWLPESAPSLYAKVLTSIDGTILEWVQPDSTNPYMKGDKVTHADKAWISDIDNNVWEPGIYGWSEITE